MEAIVTRKLAVLAVVVSLLAVPLTSARHLSVGARDGVGVGPNEIGGPPSVPGPDETPEADTPYELGTSTDCYEATGEASADAARRSTQARDFCGHLVYHADDPKLRHASPRDQHLVADEIGGFDVVRTHALEYEFASCLLYCEETTLDRGQTTFDAVHSVGSAAGLTHGPGEANEQSQSQRQQNYGYFLYYSSASRVAQQNADAWRMNGWITPTAERSYVAYLQGPKGDPITDGDLDAIVSRSVDSGRLHADTAATICGFTPDLDFMGGGTNVNCEMTFTYKDPGRTPDTDFRDGYNDECESAAYVCGGVNGPAWYGARTCTCAGLAGFGGQTDFVAWHWIVAPHQSECGGQQEPGFSFDSDGAGLPYLAHEVDVYTRATELSTTGGGPSVWGPYGYGLSVYGTATDRAVDATEPVLDAADQAIDQAPNPPGVPPAVGEAVNETGDRAFEATGDAINAAVNATWLAAKNDRVEPNNAEPIGDIDDTSKHLVEDGGILDRTLDGKCAIFNTGETEETVDPWVDLVDTQVISLGAHGPYNNTARHQDQSNDPGPGLFFTRGKVGMFTDKDDDAEYGQIGSDDKYRQKTIRETGAYPMLWDMWVDDHGNVDAEAGCSIQDERTLPSLMQDAGYGADTGMVQAIYLREPTVAHDFYTDNIAPYPAGNNIYLMLSQSAKELYSNPDTLEGPITSVDPGNPLDKRIDDLVEELSLYADRNNGDLGAPDVAIPGNEFDLPTDFLNQCGRDTGGYEAQFGFYHDCSLGCSGDTAVTMYGFQLTDATVGSTLIPGFSVDDADYPFGTGQHTWYDVDPMDANPDRNRASDSAPPEG